MAKGRQTPPPPTAPAPQRTLWGIVRGGPEVETEIREGKHDAVLSEVHEMAVRHAGPGIIGACQDRLVRLEKPPVAPPSPLQPSEHPEVKPFKPVIKTSEG